MKHVTLEIIQDEYPSNPRDDFDHISTFYGPKNSRYLIGGKKDIEIDYYDLEDTIKAFRKEGAVIVEFDSNAGTCYAVVERSQLQKEYLGFGYSMRKALYWARQCTKGEISEYLAYANGEVYGYKVMDANGEELDSCWGFYGEEYCREEGESSAQWHDEDIENKIQAEGAALKARLDYVAGN